MFCPKCGTQNPESGKFCRKCGTDLSPVSDALSGKLNSQNQGFGMIEPIQPMQIWDRKGKPVHWEGAITKFFTGIALLSVAIILGITNMAGGRFWWFWMLIPAFTMIGSGIAQYVQLKKSEKKINQFAPPEESNKTFAPASNQSLPEAQTGYVSPAESRYKTGDLVPSSVVEATTRHLEINTEGETMTLPKK